MTKLRLTKEFEFEMAHALWNYDGPCKNIHGHSYKLFITIIGEPINELSSPKHGMLIDFKDLKKLVNSLIIDRFDHAVAIYSKAPHDFIQNVLQMFEKTEILDYQPTCENLVTGFAEIVQEKLPENVALYSMKLYETSSSYCEWYSDDN